MDKKRNFTNGPVAKQMVIFAAPLFLSNLLQAIYNVVDMIVVGHVIGSVGLSAVSVGGDVQNLMTFLAMGFSNAGQIIIAQHIGAGQQEKVKRIVGNLFSILLGSAFVLSFVCFFLRKKMLLLMNTPQEAWDYALAYATTCMIGLVFIYGYNIVSAILRGMGDSKHPFMFIATAAIINLCLDLIFIIGLHMAVLGAALATVIGQGVSFIWGVIFLYRKRRELQLELELKDFIPDGYITGLLMKLGFPMAIKSAAIQVSKLFVNSSVNMYGVVASSASGIESKISMINNLVANAINVSCSTMIGQNIGAERYDRVKKILKTAYMITFSVCALFIMVLLCAPDILFTMFTQDQAVVEACRRMTLLLTLLFLGCAGRAPNNGLIDGSGNYKLNFAVALFDGIISRIGFALLFGNVLGMGWIGFLYGDAIAGFTPFVIGILYYISGTWKTRKYIIQ